MEAAASLRSWLRLYADRGADEGGCGALRTVRRVLQSALPLTFAETSRGMGNDWQVVVQTLEAFYEAPLGVDVAALPHTDSSDTECTSPAFVRLLELVLGVVVQSEEKAAFVQDILAMDASVQIDLMAAIEKVMAHGVDTPAVMNGPVVDDEGGRDHGVPPSTPISEARSPHPRSTASTPGFRSPLHLSINADFDRVKRENAVLKDENVHITEDLDTARQQLQRREAENQALTSQIQELTQDRERDLLRKEHLVHALLDDRIQQMQRELEAMAAELQEKTAIVSAVPMLRDEIDLLRPAAERVGKMDGKIAKYKAKIEELAAVKDKLRSAERVNEDLMSKNLVLESRVSKSASLQRKLDEAKDTNTSLARCLTEFRVSELESLLTRQTHELATLKNNLEASESALQETKALNQQLQETIASQLNGSAVSQNDSLSEGLSTAITGCISELNPELMQKLRWLELENDELKKQVDGETSERIDSLLDQVADLTRLKKSFETRYFDTVRLLEKTQAQLGEAQDRKADAAAELASMTRLRETSDDALSKARESIDDLQATKARQDDELLQRRDTEVTLRTQLFSRDQAVEELNATIERLQLTVTAHFEQQGILLEDVASYGMERRTSLDEQVDLMSTIQQLQEDLGTCRADTADLQQRLVAKEEDISSLRQHREALGMVKEDLETRLLLGRLRINSQRTELAVLAGIHEQAVADLEKRLMTTSKRLLEQREAASMQLEDASSTLERLQQLTANDRRALSKSFSDALTAAEERQQHLVREHNVKLVATARNYSDTICRMTDTIDAKSSALENATKNLSEYKRMHSVSNDEWWERERALEIEVEQSRRNLASQDARLAEMSAALHALEERQSCLLEANHALEAEVTRRTTGVEKLEAAMSRQELKIALLEKERARHSRQEERQRDKESVSATFSAQQNSQIDGLTAELEKLTREHQSLQVELQTCKCDRSSGSGKSDRDGRAVILNPDKKKDYYHSRIRHLEQSAQQQDDKRRELLLVNAKLVQEQKQLHIQNSKLSIEIQKLKEKLSRSLQREDRRLATEQGKGAHQAHTAQSPRYKKRIAAKEALTMVPAMQQINGEGVALFRKSVQPVLAFGSPASKKSKLDTAASSAVAKNTQPRTCADNGGVASLPLAAGAVQTRAEHPSSGVQTATAQRSKHRRLAHFFADNLPSAVSTAPKDDKPAECNQQ